MSLVLLSLLATALGAQEPSDAYEGIARAQHVVGRHGHLVSRLVTQTGGLEVLRAKHRQGLPGVGEHESLEFVGLRG
jgi:hypothetical protein